MKKNTIIFIILSLAMLVLSLCDLMVGASDVPLSSLWTEGIPHRIMMDIRLPKMLTALLAGMSLSVAGLQMQTLFRNPLAGPSVLGVTSGATLGVAFLVMMGSLLGFASGRALVALFAVVGALLVLLLVLTIAAKVHNNVTLLIVGMMVGSIAGALVNVMQNYADPDSLKLFITWTLGSLSSVGWGEMNYILPMVMVGMLMAIALIKPLNGLLLGEDYAASLGINVRLVRALLIASTGLLAGAVTAFCGPIAFIGVAIPHLARGLFRTSNHRISMPASALLGANILLVCDMVSSACTYPLPISTISALFGAPVVIYVILKK